TNLLAGALVALYPSLVLWSSLNLKDSLALLFIGIVLWLLAVFQARPQWWLVPMMYLALLPMESLRNYVFVGLVLIVPIGVAVTPRRDIRNNGFMVTMAIALSLLLLIID